jgi:hypothetical protein
VEEKEESGEKLARYWNIIQQKVKDRYGEEPQCEELLKKFRRVLERSQTDPRIDRALGAIYGALIGDALGAYCEFQRHLDPEVVDEGIPQITQPWK